ncbi:hypothetical protein EDS67_13485 [candidate division KSB1 bacterium]|nr:MAG: hypothetical protein EDS67_13485 [candidate division KSB1 bacterium]MBC6951996.1 hypothetical protein [candidate division KSB1 bacterium]MCE7942844.1 hypothetical protein [Chlorobi bacterium CHB1]
MILLRKVKALLGSLGVGALVLPEFCVAVVSFERQQYTTNNSARSDMFNLRGESRAKSNKFTCHSSELPTLTWRKIS